jgi:hypothetical protein
MGLRSAVLALGCALAVSCGGLQSSSPPATPPPTGALTAWKDFPVNRNPRPIILLEDVTPGLGFSSGDGKLAFNCGKFASSAPLPTTSPPRARVTWADGTYETFTAVSANDAFIAMGANVRGKSTDCTTVPPLSVTQTRFGSETYQTDRGQRRSRPGSSPRRARGGRSRTRRFRHPRSGEAAGAIGRVTARASVPMDCR